MTSHEILKADVLDILFDNRNKMYGAYELRKNYNNRMGIALGLTLSVVFCALFFLNSPPEKSRIVEHHPERKTVTTIDIPKTPAKPEMPQKPMASTPVKQKNFVDRFKLVPDDVKTDVPTQTELITSVISNKDVEGPALTDQVQPAVAGNSGTETGTKPEPKPDLSPTRITKAAEFPGGQSAWMAFLSKHLRTPDELNAGEKRTVLVRFTVSAEGSISNFEIIRSGGDAFDNEVIRVLKKMPKWKPAFQNSHNVSVIFTQPVTFMAFEE